MVDKKKENQKAKEVEVEEEVPVKGKGKEAKKAPAKEPEPEEVDFESMTLEELTDHIIDEEIATAKEIKKQIGDLKGAKAKAKLMELVEPEEGEGEEGGDAVDVEEMDLDELKAYVLEKEILSKKELKVAVEGLNDKKAKAKLIEIIGDADEAGEGEEAGEGDEGDEKVEGYDYEESEARLVEELEEGATLTKAELIAHYATFSGLKKSQAAKQLNMVFDFAGLLLINGCTFTYTDFGKFSVTERPARNGRNPATGATIKIPAKKQAKFKPATFIKDWINGED